MAGSGRAKRGAARRGKVGTVWYGKAGKVRRGMVWCGEVRLGEVWCGMAW